MAGSFKNKGGTAENIRPLQSAMAVRDILRFRDWKKGRKENER